MSCSKINLDELVAQHYAVTPLRVAFQDYYSKDLNYEPEVTLEVPHNTTHDKLRAIVAEKLCVDLFHLQFYRCKRGKCEPELNPVPFKYPGSVEDLVGFLNPEATKYMFYNIVPLRFDEQHGDYKFRCTWVSMDLKNSRNLVLRLPQHATVNDVLCLVRKEMCLPKCKVLRLLEVVGDNIYTERPEHITLSLLETMCLRTYRVEEVPESQQELADNEFLIPVGHFFMNEKCEMVTFGTPFFLMVRVGETVSMLAEKLLTLLAEMEVNPGNYTFHLVQRRKVRMILKANFQVRPYDFNWCNSTDGHKVPMRTWLGLQHVRLSKLYKPGAAQ